MIEAAVTKYGISLTLRISAGPDGDLEIDPVVPLGALTRRPVRQAIVRELSQLGYNAFGNERGNVSVKLPGITFQE